MKTVNEQLELSILRLTELGLLSSLPSFVVNLPTNGRLRGKMDDLENIANTMIRNTPYGVAIYKRHLSTITTLLNSFGTLSGWKQNSQHVTTVVSFFVMFLENSRTGEYPRVVYNTLADILDYYERVGDVPENAFSEGDRICDVWNSLPISITGEYDDELKASLDRLLRRITI